MKIAVYLSLHLLFVMCIPVHAILVMTDDDIYQKMHVPMKHCGTNLADLMTLLCIKHNGYRSKRSITKLTHDCCNKPCTFYHIMKYYCDEPKVQVTEEALTSSTEISTRRETWVQITTESINQSSENSGQATGTIPNKIEKQFFEQEKKPADYGYVRSTRPPIIYRPSSTIERGGTNYKLLNNTPR